MYLHAIHNLRIIREDMQGFGLAMLIYVTPLFVGIVLILFVLKPLVAMKPQPLIESSFNLDKHPLLKRYILHICKMVGSPIPAKIEIDCNPRISAKFQYGLIGALTQNVKLTIGLPVIAALDTRAIGGQLIKEMSYFTQTTGVRFRHVIRYINQWFESLVFERDQWDEDLQHFAKSKDYRLTFLILAAQICIAATRPILWALMMIGNSMSAFMLRSLEYKTDAYGTRFNGSATFLETTERLALLRQGHELTRETLLRTWKFSAVSNDFPKWVLDTTTDLPDGVVEEVVSMLASGKTKLSDIRPSHTDRRAAILKLKEDGIFHSKQPATELFTDYEKTSRDTSSWYYRYVEELDLKTDQLVDPDEVYRRNVEDFE